LRHDVVSNNVSNNETNTGNARDLLITRSSADADKPVRRD